MITINFDETCTGWTSDIRSNELFLVMQRRYFNDLLERRGYLYLNYIYESLGLEWNPDNENVCYRLENGRINLDFERAENRTFLVKIY